MEDQDIIIKIMKAIIMIITTNNYATYNPQIGKWTNTNHLQERIDALQVLKEAEYNEAVV